ncbi:uncharacterized protein CC84DRAFT_463684 [Paraphaeosphaeria sporulosa]|uniref:Uncharacterized protein n=1 Tax=Paraphaeosphaeria sporulosa TaxID=1460663 RepID=A0A177CTJ0_9PLEO|nr:uncharacterized protein CC84DRAFT_463684 [Paraphaeosphaeria sporulosa]OAG10097.1 hypothetical protein CC84DRAFT_463684 [Paraphaeosphaeria sporulosa]
MGPNYFSCRYHCTRFTLKGLHEERGTGAARRVISALLTAGVFRTMAFLLLSFVCRHTQELDVWASTFTLPFYFDTTNFHTLNFPACP